MKERWQTYSDRTKSVILTLAALLTFLAAWSGSFRTAFEEHEALVGLEHKRDSLVSVVARGAGSNARQTQLEPTTIPQAQSELIAILKEQSKERDLEIDLVPQYEMNLEYDRQIVTLTSRIEGGFHHQLRLISALENTLKRSYLQSIILTATKHRNSKEMRLYNQLEFKAIMP